MTQQHLGIVAKYVSTPEKLKKAALWLGATIPQVERCHSDSKTIWEASTKMLYGWWTNLPLNNERWAKLYMVLCKVLPPEQMRDLDKELKTELQKSSAYSH